MDNKFEYKYEAPSMEERKEIDSIRRNYLPRDGKDKKIERIKALDNRVKSIPVALSISVGVIGLLIFGISMVFFLEWTNFWFLGIPFAIISLPIILMGYPIYLLTYKVLSNKYKDEIIELSNSLLEE